MGIVGIVFIIIGALIAIFFGIIFISSASILNKASWDKFIEQAREKGLDASEDELYKMVVKLNAESGLILIIGLITVVFGIIIKLFL